MLVLGRESNVVILNHREECLGKRGMEYDYYHEVFVSKSVGSIAGDLCYRVSRSFLAMSMIRQI